MLKECYRDGRLVWNSIAGRAPESEYEICGLILLLFFFASACLLRFLCSAAVKNRNDVALLNRSQGAQRPFHRIVFHFITRCVRHVVLQAMARVIKEDKRLLFVVQVIL